MPRPIAILTVVVIAGGASRVTSSVVQAPNPNGCYAYVYENPAFGGARYILNGPARFRTLKRTLSAGELGWDNRIRSVRVGEAAALTVFTESSFGGRSMRLLSGTVHAQLEPAFAGHIQSAMLECNAPAR
jgi:hypothetical protein